MKLARYSQLINIVKNNNCKKIMEVGTHKGKSALRMINASISNSLKPSDIHYYGFDLFELMTKEIFEKEVSKWPVSEEEVFKTLSKTGANINLYKGFSKNTLIEFSKLKICPDIVFIDGGHSIETLEGDWNIIKDIIGDKTIVVFDDYISNFDEKKYGCNGLINSLDENKWNVEILPVKDVINESLSINFVKVNKK